MAELYARQGFRDEALAIYRQLLQRDPGNPQFADRVRQLSAGAPHAAGSDAASREADAPASVHAGAQSEHDRAGPTLREVLAHIASRRVAPGADVATPVLVADVGAASAGPAAVPPAAEARVAGLVPRRAHVLRFDRFFEDSQSPSTVTSASTGASSSGTERTQATSVHSGGRRA